ncbi:hypothetical protein BDZ90DRAFT_248978 [Jaminaea rosea]|uniref:Rdx family-domain-containing protein n=1 Tax=Jaminaea rosea TaxID=1569628 RepID=A0A316UVL9_9BASI|nr:hypothetical protein BDZ90DRAFT_248978 [Jaminaea rosea]PWN29346.1 hypothetical protein BDZ90DRAFT_248978 [Jaminaea rosea]
MSSSGPSSSATTSAAASSSALPSTYSSFQPPSTLHLPPNSIAIEYCDRCRWQHRASWTQTELLVTFGPKPAPSAAILPKVEEDSAGRFRVWVYHRPNEGQGAGEEVKATCIYDRKTMGRFPEMKELKQLVRDIISPGASLGHSDKKGTAEPVTTKEATQSAAEQAETKARQCEDC